MVLLILVTAFLSAWLDNVTTVLLIAEVMACPWSATVLAVAAVATGALVPHGLLLAAGLVLAALAVDLLDAGRRRPLCRRGP
ncbi:hypothetical protein UK14_23365 [Streptomyces sp. NRRL F-4428]|nr:hypothetical protein UK14_23365 [Streptomyces sp. NRRL F-4428]